jgi:rubrerythrin
MSLEQFSKRRKKMKTSKEWWTEVKASKEKLASWLQAQFVGETGAAVRIRDFQQKFGSEISQKQSDILNTIADQEMNHASWVKTLLESRGIATVDEHSDRYWKEILPSAVDYKTGAAVGAHAEKMRLERIQVIADDEEADKDIRDTFRKILKEEIFHERAFREMAGSQAMNEVSEAQGRAMEAIGLIL